ncbi:hypothetical protein [Streptomyces sp. NPDC056937]|uniref:hypothetical protein n=1 Tax=Streptomyces sp. NPDC056937 TaxID=3345969 RepID=UPI0036349861
MDHVGANVYAVQRGGKGYASLPLGCLFGHLGSLGFERLLIRQDVRPDQGCLFAYQRGRVGVVRGVRASGPGVGYGGRYGRCGGRNGGNYPGGAVPTGTGGCPALALRGQHGGKERTKARHEGARDRVAHGDSS